MAYVCFQGLFALLTLVNVHSTLHALPLSVPEIVEVKAEEKENSHFGVWKMNIKWRNNFIDNNKPEKAIYDLEIYYTEQMRRVHTETLEVKPDLMGMRQWVWTSSLPLQCTSHSVRLRLRDQSHISAWTPFYILKGKDTEDVNGTMLFPENLLLRVGEAAQFCCIVKAESGADFRSSDFKIRIGNRTFATEPILRNVTSTANGFDLPCEKSGLTYYTGYPPDVRNFTCVTRDLSSVECRWNPGKNQRAVYKEFVVKYSVNGRSCTQDECVLDESIDSGVTNWTLTAENALDKQIVSDIANPKHRVQLKSPKLSARLVHLRNVTLEMEWSEMLKYSSFPVICQVEINGHVIEETFSGTGLKSLFLRDLQPFTEYRTRVRCGSRDHFYRWGDWSDIFVFLTKEDIPEAVDVWRQVLGGHSYVLWKHPTVSQSHGNITGYELLLQPPGDGNEISKSADEHCHKLSSLSAERNYSISVSARNSAGVSPPSKITIPSLWSDSTNTIRHINGHNGSFNIAWEPSSNSSYVVEWFPTYDTKPCSVQWMKIASNVSHAIIDSDFKPGVKYTLSVYAFTSDTPQLLQRREGYAEELAPSATVHNLKAKDHNFHIELSWDDVPEKEQHGFILGYTISYKKRSNAVKTGHGQGDSSEEKKISIKDPSTRVYTLKNLDAGEYTIRVTAFTSAGEGPNFEVFYVIDTSGHRIFVSILITLITVAFTITMIALCCNKRKWLKSKLYPDVPKPVLPNDWVKEGVSHYPVIDKILISESEMLMVKDPYICLQVVPLVQKDYKEDDEIPKEPLKTTYCNDVFDPKTVPPITVDLSYSQIPLSGIQNPTYYIPLSLPSDANLVLGYMPQRKSDNNQVQPPVVTPVQMNSGGYQPQSVAALCTPEITNRTGLHSNSTLVCSSEYLLHNACS